MQLEHKAWLEANYPRQPAYIPAAGCVEEAGELMHCILKQEQEALWGQEERYTNVEWRIELADAIGDCAIYACSLCTANEWEYASLLAMARTVPTQDAASPLTAAAYVVSAAVTVVLQPGSAPNVMYFLASLLTVARLCNMSFDDCVETTWAQVKLRKRKS